MFAPRLQTVLIIFACLRLLAACGLVEGQQPLQRDERSEAVDQTAEALAEDEAGFTISLPADLSMKLIADEREPVVDDKDVAAVEPASVQFRIKCIGESPSSRSTTLHLQLYKKTDAKEDDTKLLGESRFESKCLTGIHVVVNKLEPGSKYMVNVRLEVAGLDYSYAGQTDWFSIPATDAVKLVLKKVAIDSINIDISLEDPPIPGPERTFLYEGTGYTEVDGRQNPVKAFLSVGLDAKVVAFELQRLKYTSSDSTSKYILEEARRRLGLYMGERSAKGAGGSVGYAMFFDSIIDTGGQAFNFSESFPLLPWPAAMVRYEALPENQSTEWWTEINDSYKGVMRVSRILTKADLVKIRFDFDIPSDTDGKLLGSIPIPTRADYTIDTGTRRIEEIELVDRYYEPKRNKVVDTTIKYVLVGGEKD